MFHAIATLRNLCLLTQSSQCSFLESHVSGMIKYCILQHQNTCLHHIKCANSMPPTWTFQIIHSLVLITSSEYLLILAQWNAIGDFRVTGLKSPIAFHCAKFLVKDTFCTLSTLYLSCCIFFAISYGWDLTNGNLSKSTFLKGVGHFQCRFHTEGGIVHQPLLMSE